MNRATGFRPVPKGRIEHLWHNHPLSALKLGASAPDRDLIPFAPAVDDQDGVGQCTGDGVVCAVMTTLAAAGTPVDRYLDPQSAYRMARCLERAQDYPWNGGSPPPLQDTGEDPNTVYLAGNQYGFARLRDTFQVTGPCPQLTASYGQCANLEPSLAELESSDEFKVVGQFRVLSTGQQRIDDVRAALAAGFAVTMSVFASDARYQRYAGGVLPPAPDGVGCDHLNCVVGDYTDATGATVLHVQNSWGTGWGEAGRYLAHIGILLQSDCVHVSSVRKG